MVQLLESRNPDVRIAPGLESRSPARRRTLVVCHPIWELAYGGMERQLLQVLPRITDGFDHVLLPRGVATELRQPIPPGIRLQDSSGRRRWTATLADQFRSMRADVVHVRGLGMLLDVVAAARLAGDIPVVFSFHGLDRLDQRLSWIRKPLIRRALMACDQKWAVSRSARDWIARAVGLPPERFNVIPNGVDALAFEPCHDKLAAKRAAGQPIDRPLVLAVGNIKPIKGQSVLIDAARLYQSCGAPLTIIVGADYSAKDRALSPQATACGVALVGRQANVKPWYEAADLFVLPSLSEGLSNALLEAMASGLPVVATSVGGNPDLVKSGVNGLLVPPADAAALGLAIRSLLSDEGRRRTFGAAARRTVMTGFTLDLAANKTAAAYRRSAGRDSWTTTGADA